MRKAAAQIIAIIDGGSLDLLFNNAGINISRREMTEDGIEKQFATNHVGPFLLTNLLMSLLVRGGGRVVNTSSEAHRISPVRFSDWNLEPGKEVPADEEPRRGMPEGILRGGGRYVVSSYGIMVWNLVLTENWFRYEPSVAYGQSKTANILFAVSLSSKLAATGVICYAIHPGSKCSSLKIAREILTQGIAIMTDLVRDMDEEGVKGLTSSIEVWKTADQGAATMLVAALDPKLAGKCPHSPLLRY